MLGRVLTPVECGADVPPLIWVGDQDRESARDAALRCRELGMSIEEGEGVVWSAYDPREALDLILRSLDVKEVVYYEAAFAC